MEIATDITEHKLAEEKLLESEKKYREMYDFLPIPVYEMDFAAKITSANRAVYEKFGGTEEDLKKGVSAWKLSSPEDIEKSRKNIERLLKGEKIGGTEYTLTRLDGSVFPAIAISTLIYSNGKPVGIRGAILDITDRKQAESEIRKLNESLEQRINERTAELRKIITQLEETNRTFVGREIKMIELKERIAELESRKV